MQALKGVEIDQRLFDKLLRLSTRKDGTLKPEAKVRIAWIVKFIRQYRYDSEQIDIEVAAGRVGRAAESGSDTVFADIVIYRDPVRTEPFVVMETKAPGQKGGVAQAESYARNLGAEYHAWHDGRSPALFFRTERFGQKSQPVGDIPRWVGVKPIVEEIPKSMELPPFRDENQMREVVHRCHEFILEKQGHDPAKAFDELTKLLFLKLYDEREVPSVYKFMVLATDTAKTLATRLRQLFKEAISASRYRDVFESKFHPKANVALELDDFTILEVVKLLQGFSLINTVGSIDGADIKGTVFEQMVGKTFRGELAQFFTPRELVRGIVAMIPPKATDKVLDPSCGSGGFLVMAITSLFNRLKVEHPNLNPEQLQDKISYFATHNLFGCDINDRMTRVAKMNMIMHGDGHAGVINADGFSLVSELPSQWLAGVGEEGKFTIIYSNPPFAGREKDSTVLEKFALGKNLRGKAKSISKEVLFVEMIIRLLAPGGRAGLVLPAGTFNNPSMKPLRDYIRKHTKILALVGLPHLAFQITGANNEGHLLFIEKSDEVPADYTIFIDWAGEVGIDSVGRKIGRNDLIDIPVRFKNPTSENTIRFTELKERIDPWHYHPTYAAIIRRLEATGYKWYRLDEIFSPSRELFRRGSYDSASTVKYVEKGDVEIEKGEIVSCSEHSPKSIPGRATFVLRENDILFPDIYDSMRGVAIATKKFDGYIATNRFFVVRHNPARILLDFVRHYFTKPEILALMKRECSGEINPGLTSDAFFGIRVPLPEPEEQRTILEGLHQILKEKQRLYDEIGRLDEEIESRARVCVPRLIANYEEIKIRRAEFIGDVKLSGADEKKH
jgi:type I restriction enzyme M protein